MSAASADSLNYVRVKIPCRTLLKKKYEYLNESYAYVETVAFVAFVYLINGCYKYRSRATQSELLTR
jgi:hypothetical protein